MALATAGETLVLDTLLTARYVSLHTGTPPTGEVSGVGTGYIRQAATFVKTAGPDPSVYKNSTVIQYSPAILDWGSVTYFGIWTAASGGTLLAYAPVNTTKNVTANDVVRWEINSLTVSTD